jgi:glycosyltransferase involved in cell wall biosynthesis
MSIGLPCVATDCRPGGAAFLIKDGVNGLLAPCGDEKTFSEKMLFLADHPIDAEIYGLEAKKIIDTYSEQKIAALWENYLRSLCDAPN